MEGLAFTVLGFLLGLVPGWYVRKRRLKTHWCALRAEVELCAERAETLLSASIQSPLYRLPVIAYQTSYPVLLADGAVDEQEVLTLGRFFGQVEDINRGLDNAAEANMSGGSNKLKAEYERNLLKAEGLVRNKENATSLLAQTRAILDAKVQQKWWKYGKHA